MKKIIINTRYIFISGRKKVLKKFRKDGDDIIFRSPKSLFEFLEKIDFSYHDLMPCKKTIKFKDFKESEYGMTLGEAVFPGQIKIIYVETKFPTVDKMIMQHTGLAVFGKNLYYCEHSITAEKRMIFIIIFSHGICIYCYVDIYNEENFDIISKEIGIVNSPCRYLGNHVKAIVNEITSTLNIF